MKNKIFLAVACLCSLVCVMACTEGIANTDSDSHEPYVVTGTVPSFEGITVTD